MKYYLDRTWLRADKVEVTANTLEDAIEKAYDAPLTVGEYIDDSLIVHTDYYEEEPEDDTPNP